MKPEQLSRRSTVRMRLQTLGQWFVASSLNMEKRWSRLLYPVCRHLEDGFCLRELEVRSIELSRLQRLMVRGLRGLGELMLRSTGTWDPSTRTPSSSTSTWPA